MRSELGAITAVVHGAGVNRPAPVDRVSVDAAYREVAPKTLGAWNLLRCLDDRPPLIVVGMTSIIGVTGLAGNAWYGFSNELLDRILGQFAETHPGTEALSAAFSVWGEAGMAQFGVLIGAAVITLVTSLGGFRGVAWTDLFQGLLMAFALFALPLWAVARLGGFGALASGLGEADAGFLTAVGSRTMAAAAGFIIGNLGIGLGYPGMPHEKVLRSIELFGKEVMPSFAGKATVQQI